MIENSKKTVKENNLRCHLVYSLPNSGSLIRRFPRKIKKILQKAGLNISAIRDRQNIDTDFWPKCSPFENTKHLYKGFSDRMPTFLYHLNEQVRCSFEPDDIFVGHPVFPYVKGTTGVTDLSLNQKSRPKVFALISPLHCNINIKTNHLNQEYLDSIDKLIPRVDVLFSIMGQYWWDVWDTSPYAHWKSKMIRLDMAIDIDNFPIVKNRFNSPGRRGFLYIGRNDPGKGIELLIKLLSEQGNFPCGWIGSGPDIPGIQRISKSRPLTPQFMSQLAKNFDFFITTGVADANPTTILESMAWGFPVICTPQSGYYATEYRYNVFHEDIEKSISILNYLQYIEEERLIKIARQARAVVEHDYTWEKFLNTIFNVLDKFIIQ